MQTLHTQVDDDEPNQTYYIANVTIPHDLPHGPTVLRTTYYTNNPAAGAAYYSVRPFETVHIRTLG